MATTKQQRLGTWRIGIGCNHRIQLITTYNRSSLGKQSEFDSSLQSFLWISEDFLAQEKKQYQGYKKISYVCATNSTSNFPGISHGNLRVPPNTTPLGKKALLRGYLSHVLNSTLKLPGWSETPLGCGRCLQARLLASSPTVASDGNQVETTIETHSKSQKKSSKGKMFIFIWPILSSCMNLL